MKLRPAIEKLEPYVAGKSVAAVRRELGLPDPEHVGVVDALWDDVAGPALASHSTVRFVRDGTCVVAVDTPHWATQSRYLEAAFVERAASVLGAGVAALGAQHRLGVGGAQRGAQTAGSATGATRRAVGAGPIAAPTIGSASDRRS